MRLAVLDIEPIEPALGGSRLRLAGLYHALGHELETLYVGAYHWPGPAFRTFRHGPHFEEITIPFSDRHFAAAAALQAEVGDYSIIDSSFPALGALSEDYCRRARAAATEADIVIFSHPWAWAVAGDAVKGDRQLVLYDAHNVEAIIKRQLLDGTPTGRRLADEAERLERALCHAADLVLACSHQDRQTLARLHDLPFAKLRVCPNGVFARRVTPASLLERLAAKARLRLGLAPVALFIGGHYPPNLEAVGLIRDRLAPACPGVTFAILGDAGNALREPSRAAALPGNLRATGRVDEATKGLWLKAADIGINPMFSGSGTNIKMFDYMAAGLPVVTTPFGARGIEGADFAVAADAGGLAAEIARLAANRRRRAGAGRRNRTQVERAFDWATISDELGALLVSRARDKRRAPPFFSVTVPTLDRPLKLRRLLDLLAMQRDRDFEVIVVDQSEKAFDGDACGLDLTVLRSPVLGQCRARNLAATVARGQVLALIDDDCEPCDTWLSAARAVFDRPAVVGLEGRCFSDRRHDPAWRSVDNYSVEGLGFMTCNLFVRAEAFHVLGGFDLAFDEVQFRYDTDFGWRLQALGEVPFSEAAFVYHPPWSRALRRESETERDRLFESDPLLLRKHPGRYRELILREGHWRKGQRFWRPFLRGATKHGIELPDDIDDLRRQAGAGE
jgi:glycosyltransferase involved in cell wall biosynthesis